MFCLPQIVPDEYSWPELDTEGARVSGKADYSAKGLLTDWKVLVRLLQVDYTRGGYSTFAVAASRLCERLSLTMIT